MNGFINFYPFHCFVLTISSFAEHHSGNWNERGYPPPGYGAAPPPGAVSTDHFTQIPRGLFAFRSVLLISFNQLNLPPLPYFILSLVMILVNQLV